MQNQDDKYFEELARQKFAADEPQPPVQLETIASADAEWEAESTRASATVERKRAPKMHTKKFEDEGEADGQLTIDVYQTPSEIIIESAIAGVRAEDIDIDVTTDSITIKGQRERQNEVGDEDYFYRECYWGRFSRSVILPEEIDPESASVTFKNGLLRVRLPKANKKKAKKLRVKFD